MKKNNRDTIIDSHYFPYILIRDQLLANLLGKEAPEILYWSGKELARQFPLSEDEDVIGAFHHCGFGTLSLIKESKSNAVYHLSGDLVKTRLRSDQATFQLEAGFLAEQLSRTQRTSVEAQVRLKNDEVVEFSLDYS